MVTKTEQTRAASAATMGRMRSAKTKVAQAVPHVEDQPQAATLEDFMAANLPNHPWLGLFAQVGVMAVGWTATMIACNAIVGLIIGTSSSLLVLGLALIVYFFIGCISIILTMRCAAKAGDYMELRGFDQVTSTVRGWFTKTPATQTQGA